MNKRLGGKSIRFHYDRKMSEIWRMEEQTIIIESTESAFA